jgi:opacity protein-like surface antigen
MRTCLGWSVALLVFIPHDLAWADETKPSEALSRIEALEKKNASRMEAIERENTLLRGEVARLRQLTKSQPRNSALSQSDQHTRLTAQAPPVLTRAAAKSDSNTQPLAHDSSAYVADREPVENWGGVYWGTGFGVGGGRTKVRGQETYRYNCIGCSPPDNVSITNVDTQGAPYRALGAFADLSVGFNVPLGSRLVVGAQADGTIGKVNFGSRGTRSYTFSDASGVILPSPGTGSFDLQVNSPWTLTGLLRGGFLADEKTMLYGVAGWTFAQFNIPSYAYNSRFDGFINSSSDVTANGPTVGLGIERKLDKNWSVLVELRYTQFFASSLTNSSTFSDPVVTGGSDVAHTKSSSDMFTGKVGVSYLIPIGF